VRDGNTGRIETFLNVTTKESARRADRVLKNESSLIRSTQALPGNTAPAAGAGAMSDADVWTDATKSTPAAEHRDDRKRWTARRSGSTEFKAGVGLLEKTDLFNLLCILPDGRDGDVPDDVYQDAMSLCARAPRVSHRGFESGLELDQQVPKPVSRR